MARINIKKEKEIYEYLRKEKINEEGWTKESDTDGLQIFLKEVKFCKIFLKS